MNYFQLSCSQSKINLFFIHLTFIYQFKAKRQFINLTVYKFKLYQQGIQMPKLKKYSQIYGDDSVSMAFQIGAGDKNKDQEQDDNQNSNANHSRSSTSLSQKSSSENQSLSNQSNQIKIKQKFNKNISPKKTLYDNNNQFKRKATDKKKKENKYNADQILRKMQEQLAKNQEDEIQKEHDDDDQTGIQIPQDCLVGFEKKKSKNKKDKNQIKSKNKFFNFQVSQDLLIQQKNQKQKYEEDDLQQLRKLQQDRKKLLDAKNFRQASMMDVRKNQLQSKVNKIRQRMQFKNAHQDARYKQHIKQTLDGVRDCQQVQIMIEAPKIFKGSTARHTDAALYIKNMSQNATPQSQSVFEDSRSKSIVLKDQKNQEKNKSNKHNKNVDRKQFYQQVGKKVKQTKIFDFRTQPSGIFKKSSLDQLGQEFQKNEHLFKQDQASRKSLTSRRSLSNVSNRSLSNTSRQQISVQGRNRSQEKISEFKLDQKSQGCSKKIHQSMKLIQIVQQDQSNQDSKKIQIKLQTTKIQTKILSVQQNQQNQKLENKLKQGKEVQKHDKKKVDRVKKESNKKDRRASQKQKNKKQKVSKQIRQLFQQEAQDSQNGYGDDGQSSGSEDNKSVQSLIDRKEIKYIEKYERQAMKKFMEEEHQRDQMIIQKIKEKITNPRKIKCQQSSQSRQRRKRRMNDAKKKFQQEDGNDYGKFCDDDKDIRDKNNNTKQQIDDFEKQLKNFEDEIRVNQTSKQDSKGPFSSGIFEKNKIQWKQVKTTNKSGKNQKRGGFVNQAKVIIGPKIKSKKAVSRPKNINF